MNGTSVMSMDSRGNVVEIGSKAKFNRQTRIEAAKQNLDVVTVSDDIARKHFYIPAPTYFELYRNVQVFEKVIRWFATGRTGLSSMCMAVTLMNGSPLSTAKDYPRDPADLSRCIKLLDAVPELREKLSEMAKVSSVWAALIAQWDQLEALFKEESRYPEDSAWRAPKTFELMQKIIESVQAK
ncbi:TPA: hypothetical protein ACNICG_003433 [Acinetobacter baumannii]